MYSREELVQYEYFNRVLEGRRITDVLDPLTGLISKTHMIAFVQSLIEEKIPFTFGMIDLDNFKYINDTYGHSMGDQMLAAVSENLRDFLRGYGIAGRFGGDEFLFVNFRDLDYAANKLFCQTLFGTGVVLRKTFHLTKYDLFMTGTAGLANYPKDADNYLDLFTLIDKVLYRGKSKGRNCYIIYTPEKHKNIEVIRIKKNSLYDTFKNLAAAFDSSDTLHGKLKAGFEALKSDLNITDLYYTGKRNAVKSVLDQRFLGYTNDIDRLMNDEAYATNQISQIKETSPRLYAILSENEAEAVLIMKVNVGPKTFGYLMCAEPHTLRIWQEKEYAAIFLLARMLAEFLDGNGIELE